MLHPDQIKISNEVERTLLPKKNRNNEGLVSIIEVCAFSEKKCKESIPEMVYVIKTPV